MGEDKKKTTKYITEMTISILKIRITNLTTETVTVYKEVKHSLCFVC